jgi:hypothetical protein
VTRLGDIQVVGLGEIVENFLDSLFTALDADIAKISRSGVLVDIGVVAVVLVIALKKENIGSAH